MVHVVPTGHKRGYYNLGEMESLAVVCLASEVALLLCMCTYDFLVCSYLCVLSLFELPKWSKSSELSETETLLK